MRCQIRCRSNGAFSPADPLRLPLIVLLSALRHLECVGQTTLTHTSFMPMSVEMPKCLEADLNNHHKTLRILLVEDHDDTAEVTAKLLRKCGHTVTVAKKYKEATEAGAEEFDLLICDIGLPDGSGIDVFTYLRRSNTNFRSIAVTGFGMPEEVQKCLEAGFDGHLLKPITFPHLEEMIDRVAGAKPSQPEVDGPSASE